MTTAAVTIPGAVEGLNGRLLVSGYGSRTVRVERINYSVEIYTEEASSAHGKAFYPGWLQDSDFGLDIVHLSVSERDKFNTWLRTYMTRVTSGGIAQGSMLVQVPARKFARRAVPSGTLNFGDALNQQGKGYRTSLLFKGATDPISIRSASAFRAARTDPEVSAPFYPSSGQKKGAESLDGTIFDTSGDDALSRLIGSGYGATRVSQGLGGA